MLLKNHYLFFFYAALFFVHFGYAGGDKPNNDKKITGLYATPAYKIFKSTLGNPFTQANNVQTQEQTENANSVDNPGCAQTNNESLVSFKDQSNSELHTDNLIKNRSFFSNQTLLTFSAGGILGFCAGVLIHKLYLYVDDRNNNVRSARIWRGVKKQASGFKKLLQIISFSIA